MPFHAQLSLGAKGMIRGSSGRWLAALVGAVVLTALSGCGTSSHHTANTSAGASTAVSPNASDIPIGSSPSASTSPSASAAAVKPSGAVPPAPVPRPPVPRTGKPGPGNTGVVPGTHLAVVTGDRTYSANGQVITGMDFHGFVKVTGSNITFQNCVFRGGSTTSNAALLDTESGTNTVIEDSEFVPAHPYATIDDVWTNRTSIYRANIHGGVDGVKTGSNVLIQDSWIHDMTWFASDPNQGGGETHNDGVQSFYGDATVTLRHNFIDLTGTHDPNAAWQDSANNSHVEGNWLDGGGCILNFAGHETPLTGLYVTGNRFGRHSFYQCPILLSLNASLSANSGNVWDDTGGAIPAPQQHN